MGSLCGAAGLALGLPAAGLRYLTMSGSAKSLVGAGAPYGSRLPEGAPTVLCLPSGNRGAHLQAVPQERLYMLVQAVSV